jgi:FkbM family methyltransferase
LNELKYGIFVDVGAYLGLYTVLAAKHGWNVVAFEPNPISLILLNYNIALHGIENRVTIVGKAAGDTHCYAKFSITFTLSKSSLARDPRNKTRLLNVVV